MWNGDATGDWSGDDLYQGDQADTALDPAVEDLSALTPLDTLAPEDATETLAAPDPAVTGTGTPIGEVPAELDVEPRFGAATDVTADSWEEEYRYLNSTGTYVGDTSGREIDPWTDTEQK